MRSEGGAAPVIAKVKQNHSLDIEAFLGKTCSPPSLTCVLLSQRVAPTEVGIYKRKQESKKTR